ncbi:dihydrolipoyl dehydrogenase [Bradyrhizobium sp. BRP14]|nr:dihydrolipoyl dehydrogenase [Bradyrhizobium sp. BRP14]
MNANFDFDVIVIGAGPGGYTCAIRASQLGLKTACVDSRDTLGGTCLNVGCIPSKALLNASHHFHAAVKGNWDSFGIKVEGVSFDLTRMMAQKEETVRSLTKGIDFLFKKNKVTRLLGNAQLAGQNRVRVGGKSVTAKSIVIATGSTPASFLSTRLDNDKGVIVDSAGALSLKSVPARMIVVGGGVIGLELGSVWSRLGAEVTVLEYLDEILPGMDHDVRTKMRKLLQIQGLQVRTSVEVQTIERIGNAAKVTLLANGSQESSEADVVLIATGRRPNTADLGLSTVGIAVDERGFIPVNKQNRTTAEGIYAIGDVTIGPMLAHRAEDDGIALAERLAGVARDVNHAVVPSVVYTDPEAASVGLTEDAVKATGRPYKVFTFPMAANSRAKANREPDGFVKLVADKSTDVVLGAHMVASVAGTMVAQIAQAMEFGATAEDIAYTCHAHPTHSEAIKEAALAIGGAPIHA